MWMRPLLLVTLLTVGCGGAAPADPHPSSSPRPDVATWMRTHYVEGRGIRDALVRGEPDEARDRLVRVTRLPSPRGAPASWEPPIEALRASASRATEAEDLPALSGALSELAARCAACHVATDAAVTFDSPNLPAASEDAPAPMQHHQWAAERMWQGLVAPDPTRYREAAAALAEAPLHSAEVVVGQAPPLEVVRIAERARDVAGRASRAETEEERAALYGELVATCAGCHGQL